MFAPISFTDILLALSLTYIMFFGARTQRDQNGAPPEGTATSMAHESQLPPAYEEVSSTCQTIVSSNPDESQLVHTTSDRLRSFLRYILLLRYDNVGLERPSLPKGHWSHFLHLSRLLTELEKAKTSGNLDDARSVLLSNYIRIELRLLAILLGVPFERVGFLVQDFAFDLSTGDTNRAAHDASPALMVTENDHFFAAMALAVDRDIMIDVIFNPVTERSINVALKAQLKLQQDLMFVYLDSLWDFEVDRTRAQLEQWTQELEESRILCQLDLVSRRGAIQ